MISHEIIGDDMQAVVVSMTTGDEIRAEAGAMTYMTDASTWTRACRAGSWAA